MFQMHKLQCLKGEVTMTQSRFNIGLAMKLVRVEKQLKQEEVAKKIGVSTAMVCLIENGKRSPSIETFADFCFHMNADPSDLFKAAYRLAKR